MLKPDLQSSVVEIKIKHGAMTMISTQKTVTLRVNENTNCMATAIEYPNGFFESKGNLKNGLKWEQES